MKVNITGRGIIPGLGVIPPIYNKEMSIPAISRLLNFPNFSVFDATTGIRFTKKNIKNVAMNTQSPYTGVDVDPPKTPDKQTKVPEPPVIEEAPVVESEEVTAVSEPEETPVIEETAEVTSNEDVVEETVDTTDEVEETETVDEEPTQQQTSNGYNNYNRKKNKKRH